MTDGTTLVGFRHWLTETLQGRSALLDTVVAYSKPTRDIEPEALWFDDATGAAERSGGDGTAEETYDLGGTIEVLAINGRDDYAADLRANTILGELRTVLRGDLGGGVADAFLAGWEHRAGPLSETGERGSRFDFVIRVTARA